MDASDWDDKRILEQTTMKQAAVNAALFNLSLDVGDGSPIVSDASSPDELRKHMIAWCEGVRAEIRARAQRAKETARAAVQAAAPEVAPGNAGPLQTPQNAVAYAEKQYLIASDMLADFTAQKARLEVRIEEVRQNRDVWGDVVRKFSTVLESADDLPE